MPICTGLRLELTARVVLAATERAALDVLDGEIAPERYVEPVRRSLG
jgi:hypothetical protein